eukprot:7697473-Karenia_brevis.AAC.1
MELRFCFFHSIKGSASGYSRNQLAADWDESDVLSSDFFRTFRHADFDGLQFSKFAEEMLGGKFVQNIE